MLQAAIQATKQPEITPSDHLVQSWVQLAMQGVRSVDSQTRLSAQESVRALDARLSRQLAAIMQHPDFQRLEGAWRGFFFLVRQMEIGSASGLFVLNCSLEELAEDMLRRDTIEQSLLYRWLYSQRLEVRDEVPLGVLLADFEFGRAASDFQVLDRLSQIAAETFCPLVTSPAPELLDLSGWDQLSTIRDPFAREPSDIRSAWQAFRNCPTAWMVGWTVPRLLARLPYGADTRPIEAFEFEELDGRSSSDTKPTPSSRFCWSSSIYGYGLILAQASAGQGWCIRIEGYEAARLENLPVFVRSLDDDEFEIIGPAECSLSESLIGKVATHGFIPLANYAQRRSVAFASSCSACEVPRAGNPADDRDLMIATGMPSVFVISRLAQMLKLFVRDNLPGTMGPQELENQLVRWLQSKVSQRPTADNGQPHGRPLASAQLGIQTDPDQPHQRVAVMRLQPWLYGEQLHRPLTVMVKI
jgi:type VI secretion system protein ImpC